MTTWLLGWVSLHHPQHWPCSSFSFPVEKQTRFSHTNQGKPSEVLTDTWKQTHLPPAYGTLRVTSVLEQEASLHQRCQACRVFRQNRTERPLVPSTCEMLRGCPGVLGNPAHLLRSRRLTQAGGAGRDVPPAATGEQSELPSEGRSRLIESSANPEMFLFHLTALLVPDSPPCLNSNDAGCFETSSKEILIKA